MENTKQNMKNNQGINTSDESNENISNIFVNTFDNDEVMVEYINRFVYNVNKLLKEKKGTYVNLAHATGLSAGNLSRYFSAKKNNLDNLSKGFSLYYMATIAAALNVPLEQLLIPIQADVKYAYIPYYSNEKILANDLHKKQAFSDICSDTILPISIELLKNKDINHDYNIENKYGILEISSMQKDAGLNQGDFVIFTDKHQEIMKRLLPAYYEEDNSLSNSEEQKNNTDKIQPYTIHEGLYVVFNTITGLTVKHISFGLTGFIYIQSNDKYITYNIDDLHSTQLVGPVVTAIKKY